MKRTITIVLMAALLLCLSGCGSEKAPAPAAAETSAAAETPAAGTDAGTVIRLTGDGAEIQGGGARVQGSAVTIGAVGTYTVSGTLNDGQLIVDTGDEAMDVTLILDGVSISNSIDAALYIRQAKNVRLQLLGTSTLISGTEADLAAYDDTASGAALFSEDDLDIEGTGTLEIRGYLNNGITCKDDLDINSGTITVLAANNGIRASESIQLKGGAVTVSSGNDGLKTSSVKKDGKGYVEIRGGELRVNAAGDGIQAASELLLQGGSVQICAEKQALQAEGGIHLGGGELLALCDSNKQAPPDSSELPWLLCNMTGRDGDQLTVGEIGSIRADCGYKMVLCASEALPAGGTVTLANGRSSVTATVQ